LSDEPGDEHIQSAAALREHGADEPELADLLESDERTCDRHHHGGHSASDAGATGRASRVWVIWGASCCS
jgi:hypothetical protein